MGKVPHVYAKTLENTGVLGVNKYLQTQFPGYLRAAGLAIGMASGMKAKAGYLGTIIRAFAGGVGGYVAEKSLSYSPDQLKKIYSGEEKIPVRRGRWVGVWQGHLSRVVGIVLL